VSEKPTIQEKLPELLDFPTVSTWTVLAQNVVRRRKEKDIQKGKIRELSDNSSEKQKGKNGGRRHEVEEFQRRGVTGWSELDVPGQKVERPFLTKDGVRSLPLSAVPISWRPAKPHRRIWRSEACGKELRKAGNWSRILA